MADLTFAEIQDFLSKGTTEKLPELSIVILRNISVEPIEPYLRYFAQEMGFHAKVTFGQFDAIYMESVGDAGGPVVPNLDCILIFNKLEVWSPLLARQFPTLSSERVTDEIMRMEKYCRDVVTGIRAKCPAMILWHAFELPVFPALGIFDGQTETGQTAAIAGMNSAVRNILSSQKNAYIVDSNACLLRLGAGNYFDLRYWHMARAPYAREALRELALEDSKFFRALKGKNRKCLVLDCDNTLWGGIIGEDGLQKIKIGKSYPGSAWLEFQEEALNLYHRGILLALCSKNNESDVWEVFDQHPDMVLRRKHFASVRINWNSKPENLEQIAAELNIGLDSMVLADDSEFEINLVKSLVPQVAIIRLPPDRPSEYRQILSSCGFFDTLAITREDKTRGEMYQAEVSRKKLLEAAPDLQEYYRSLEMLLEIRHADAFSIPRIAQLTQKTNQFNLTTRRYSDADIQTLAQNPNYDVLYLKVSDRFGDMGIVGVGILLGKEQRCIIDTFLLSCRVLGRKLEKAFLRELVSLARMRGYQNLVGEFVPTKKNGQVELFFAENGFSPYPTEMENQNESPNSSKLYFFNLQNPFPEHQDIFKNIQTDY